MGVLRLATTQVVSAPRDEVWAFFADPRNLAVVTPPWLRLRFTSPPPERVYPGLVVSYEVRPFLGFPLAWATEITQVVEGERFVDDQRVGPYRLWHHQHELRDVEGGTEIRDTVHYALPLGPLGDVIARQAVRPRVAAIFEFRRAVLRERFGPGPPVIR